MGNSLTSTIEESLFELIIVNLINQLRNLLETKSNSDSDVRRKQKTLVKILLDAKNECIIDAKNEIVSFFLLKKLIFHEFKRDTKNKFKLEIKLEGATVMWHHNEDSYCFSHDTASFSITVL